MSIPPIRFLWDIALLFYLGYVPSTVYVYADDILTSYTYRVK